MAPKKEMLESVKKFQKHIFRARGMIPLKLAEAKEELSLALEQIVIQRRLGAPNDDLNTMENYIKRIMEGIYLNDAFLAQDIFKNFFEWLSDKMLMAS